VSVAERFGGNLARHRKAAGLSQEEIGFQAAVHRTEVSQLERGLRVPRIDTLVKLAATLGVEPGALLEGIAWTPASMQPGRFEQPDADATL
jgi:transcriptional regulator with XRE-family HTH domain